MEFGKRLANFSRIYYWVSFKFSNKEKNISTFI